MATGKNHSIQHNPGDVARYCDAINTSCDPPENAHKKWVKEQGVCTNQGDQVQLTMMIHSLHKEASALLCEGVQGKPLHICKFIIFLIFCIHSILLHILHIIMINPSVTARLEDGCEIDDWQVVDSRTGEGVPLRADRWYDADPHSTKILTSGNFAGIHINIWNRAKIRRFSTHKLVGGGTHNRGYHAFRWETILHGNAGELGKYAVLSVLPDKIARFLYEYHDTSYPSLGLPPIPLDRSNISVHGILQQQQVK
jgi:hypothetical protein